MLLGLIPSRFLFLPFVREDIQSLLYGNVERSERAVLLVRSVRLARFGFAHDLGLGVRDSVRDRGILSLCTCPRESYVPSGSPLRHLCRVPKPALKGL